jgi:hypothetical protein
MGFTNMAIATGASACLLVVPAVGPVSAQTGPSGSMKLTAAATQTLTDGDVTAVPVGRVTEIAPDLFAMPIKKKLTTANGRVKAVVLRGGLDLQTADQSLTLSRLRLHLGSLRASVKGLALGQRVKAFDITNLRVNRRSVSGILLIAPGTSSILNDHFNTYVFNDGLRFLRFKVAV